MRIAFDQELARGLDSYEDVLGRWWLGQSSNDAHQRAYRRVADYIAASFQDSPGLIVDYACGAGNLLCRLATRFPHSRLIGLDGSSYLLALARKRILRLKSAPARVSCLRTPLPDFGLRLKANLVVYAFPNLVPRTDEPAEPRATPDDLLRACALAGTTDETCQELLRSRMVSWNLRGLLRRGAHCVRIEYSGKPRAEMTRSELMRAAFEEGSDEAYGRPRKAWFRVLASAYFRSGVIEDVYHQSRDTRDRLGGYQITVLRAL